MKRITVIAGALLLAPRAALACPVCFGQTDSPLAGATNLGIIVMLGIVGAVAPTSLGITRKVVDGARGPLEASGLTTSPQEGNAQC